MNFGSNVVRWRWSFRRRSGGLNIGAMKSIAVALVLILAGGCSHNPVERARGKTLVWSVDEGPTEPTLSSAERALCDQLRGEILRTGLFSYACVYPAIDAGSPCQDGGECEGFCFAPWDVPAEAQVIGACSSTVNGNSTGNRVKNGRAIGAMIVD